MYQALRAFLEVKEKEGNQDWAVDEVQRVIVDLLALLEFQVYDPTW